MDQTRLRAITQNWGSIPATERNRVLNELNYGREANQQQEVNGDFSNLDRQQNGGQNQALGLQNLESDTSIETKQWTFLLGHDDGGCR